MLSVLQWQHFCQPEFTIPFLPHQILLLTLRLSLPSVLRFSVCAGILYIAFMFLGWLVLGPYHTKVSGGGAGGVALFRSVCHGHYGG